MDSLNVQKEAVAAENIAQPETQRKAYHPPVLTEHGQIAQVTLQTSGGAPGNGYTP